MKVWSGNDIPDVLIIFVWSAGYGHKQAKN